MNIPQTGCYIDGSWGQYATARMIAMAYKTFGARWGMELQDERAAEQVLASMAPSGADASTEAWDLVFWAADKVEQAIEDNLPDHLHAEWVDGEFYITDDPYPDN